MSDQNPAKGTSPLLVGLAWAIIGVPWLWGIVQTVQNAVKLFE